MRTNALRNSGLQSRVQAPVQDRVVYGLDVVGKQISDANDRGRTAVMDLVSSVTHAEVHTLEAVTQSFEGVGTSSIQLSEAMSDVILANLHGGIGYSISTVEEINQNVINVLAATTDMTGGALGDAFVGVRAAMEALHEMGNRGSDVGLGFGIMVIKTVLEILEGMGRGTFDILQALDKNVQESSNYAFAVVGKTVAPDGKGLLGQSGALAIQGSQAFMLGTTTVVSQALARMADSIAQAFARGNIVGELVMGRFSEGTAWLLNALHQVGLAVTGICEGSQVFVMDRSQWIFRDVLSMSNWFWSTARSYNDLIFGVLNSGEKSIFELVNGVWKTGFNAVRGSTQGALEVAEICFHGSMNIIERARVIATTMGGESAEAIFNLTMGVIDGVLSVICDSMVLADSVLDLQGWWALGVSIDNQNLQIERNLIQPLLNNIVVADRALTDGAVSSMIADYTNEFRRRR